MAEERKGGEGAAPQTDAEEKQVSKDFVALVETATTDAKTKAQSGDLNGALETLLAAEKKTRVGGDSIATAKLATLMLDLCWEARNLDQLNAQILILCKRRAQSSRAIAAVVRRGVAILEEVEQKEARITLITTLRTVSAGRIFVELERARLTRILSGIYEADGDVNKASETLQEVAVETCGAMEKKEKADFLLEQLRLTLAQKDFIRTEIVSRKVNEKTMASEGFETLRVKFYKLMIELHTFQKKALSLFRDWEAIYTTRGMADDEERANNALKHTCLFLVLSAYDNEQADMLHKLSADKRLESLPTFKALLQHFITDEIAPWPLPEQGELDAFVDSVPGVWAAELHKRVVQHNIRIISKYYQRIRFARFAQLIGQEAEPAEKFLSDMVTSKMVYARIDRPHGIVSFQKPHNANATLTDWSSNIGELLKLVETSCHLINKERMVATAATGKKR